jgi:hypothetical protein
MPNFDGTGPQGKGSKTGRGQGRCKRTPNSPLKDNPDSTDNTPAGFGRGGGQGLRDGSGGGQGQGMGRGKNRKTTP